MAAAARAASVAPETAIPQSAFGLRLASERGESLEPFRILRSALDFAAVTRDIDTLMLTSAVAGFDASTLLFSRMASATEGLLKYN